jgi:hypothetical protein
MDQACPRKRLVAGVDHAIVSAGVEAGAAVAGSGGYLSAFLADVRFGAGARS